VDVQPSRHVAKLGRWLRTERTALQAGFTLIEVLVVLTLAAVIAIISVPNFQRVRVISRDMTGLRTLATLVDSARFEAVRRHSPVVLWVDSGSNSVIVFEDWNRSNDAAPGNDNGQLDAGEEVIRRVPIDPAFMLARPGGGTAIDLGGDFLSWLADGTLRPSPSLPSTPAIYLGDVNANSFRLSCNRLTGNATIEKFVGATWNPRREQWSW
jgi:prepilin-type N-terminal cleavage/methylation domain-containing protein